MYDTQITVENTIAWFLFLLTRLDLYCLNVFVKGTWKGVGNYRLQVFKFDWFLTYSLVFSYILTILNFLHLVDVNYY